MTLCTCDLVIDQDECQCSLADSDCLTVNGSGRLNPMTVEVALNPDSENLASCAVNGLLIQLPSYVTNPPRAQAYHNAAQSTTTNIGQVLALNSEYFDTDTMHNTTTNNSRLTIVTSGIYILTWSIEFAANAAGDRQALIRKNGSEFIAGSEKKPASASFATGLNVSTVEYLKAGEYVEGWAKQDSGGSLNVTSTRYSPVLTAMFRRLPPS